MFHDPDAVSMAVHTGFRSDRHPRHDPYRVGAKQHKEFLALSQLTAQIGRLRLRRVLLYKLTE